MIGAGNGRNEFMTADARVLPLVTEADLLAYVDGQLTPHRRVAVEAHLARHPDLAARVTADLAILRGLRLLFGRVQ